ncbi:tetratricopeptide repeat protein [Thermodesulfobacteriota bacterium]
MRTATNKRSRFNYQEFPRIKGTNTYRIFCLGGSTTQGRPYTHKASFGGWLHGFLKAAAPGTNWEIINAGGASYASYRVAKLMQELVQYDPDLFIIYTGQNEFLENRSYGKLAELPPWLIDINSKLDRTRIYSAMKKMYDSVRPDSIEKAREEYKVSGEVDTILRHTAGPTSYHRDDNLQKKILNHFHNNLERMALLARDAGAKIMFITPAVNLKDMSPFKSEHKKGLSPEALDRFTRLLKKGNMLYNKGDFPSALEMYKQALRIDDRYAGLYFQMGHALFKLGQYDTAEEHYLRAVDEDVAPLRMLSPMKTILSDVAGDYNVPLVNFQSILKESYLKKYNHTVFGKEFFLDHVHTNTEGYRLLGLALYNRLLKEGIVTTRTALAPDKIDLVTKQVNASINKKDHSNALFRLAKVLAWAGKYDEAEHLHNKNLERYGPQGDVYARLGQVLARKNNHAGAIETYHKAIGAGFKKPWVYEWLAKSYIKLEKYRLAQKAYEDKLKIDGGKIEGYFQIGTMYLTSKNYREAGYYFNEILRVNPENLPAAKNLVTALYAQGQHDSALAAGRAILQRHPDSFRIHFIAGMILLQQKDRENAIKHLSRAVSISPDFKEAQHWLKVAQQQ